MQKLRQALFLSSSVFLSTLDFTGPLISFVFVISCLVINHYNGLFLFVRFVLLGF